MEKAPKEEEDKKRLPRLKAAKNLYIDLSPRLTWQNHQDVIRQLCENSVRLEEEEDEQKFIEWAKDKYLRKVKYEYPTEGDEMALRLNRVVWTGKFREIARQYFQERRDSIKKNRDSYCCFAC